MTFTTDITQQARRGYSDATMNTTELIWNARLQQSFLRENNLIVSLEWNDILGQRSNISRMISATQRSDSWSNSIYSYGMLRVMYNFNLMGSRQARSEFGPGSGFPFEGGFPGGGGGGGRGGRGGGFGGPAVRVGR